MSLPLEENLLNTTSISSSQLQRCHPASLVNFSNCIPYRSSSTLQFRVVFERLWELPAFEITVIEDIFEPETTVAVFETAAEEPAHAAEEVATEIIYVTVVEPETTMAVPKVPPWSL
ncbi:hypothetical protein HDU97_002630 [Phlyctochytrium planicorne]|nr:hypothetical protein HDU97_002630 [Phlyctochytrium planicorne]